jgi:GTP-binding protein
VNHTICEPAVTQALPHTPVDQPTIGMIFYVNDSPLGGKEGRYVTSQVIRDRLLRETEMNPSLHVKVQNDSFRVFGRGELQMVGVMLACGYPFGATTLPARARMLNLTNLAYTPPHTGSAHRDHAPRGL